MLSAAVCGLAVGQARLRGAEPPGDGGSGDVAIDETTALLFSPEAPLVPAAGLRDARAVWARVPKGHDGRVLLFLHGYNGYVTVDAQGRSRVPDWAAGDAKARERAGGKQAAPLIYGLDRIGGPIVLVPEVSTLATGAFWAKDPGGQYADPARLGALVSDCLPRLARLRRRGGPAYLSDVPPMPPRVFLSGHSGAGLPLEEAATSALLLPETGAPTDLWLFDCTYWSKVAGFVRFCERWHRAGRLGGGSARASRFVCVYRPRTQTEEVADALRHEVAKTLGVAETTLVKDHTPDNFDADVRPALETSGALFVRTHVSHDEIPKFFIPALIRTAPPVA